MAIVAKTFLRKISQEYCQGINKIIFQYVKFSKTQSL